MKQRLKRFAARHLRVTADKLDPPPKATVMWWPQHDTATATSASGNIIWETKP